MVVDSPGYGDTRLTSKDKVEEFSKCLTNAIKSNDGKGFHAFIHVMKYGNRLSDEEKDAFKAVNNILPGVMTSHGVLLLTGGDTFEHDHGMSGITFEEWCQTQNEDFQTLMRHFGERVLLFNNHTKNEAQQDAQLYRLLNLVENLPSGKRYSNVLFEASRAELLTSSPESEEDFITNSFLGSLSAVLDHFDKCRQLESKKCDAVQLEEWGKFQSRCVEVFRSVEDTEDKKKAEVKAALTKVNTSVQEYIKAAKKS